VILVAFCLPGLALAQDGEEEPQIEEKVSLRALYPKVESIAGGTFEYNVEIRYIGMADKVFDIKFTPPKGWEIYMTPRYEKEKKISSVSIKPLIGSGDEYRVVATAPFWPLPDPGEYTIVMEAISGTLSASTELIAEVTAKYILQTVPANERYDTKAKAGEESIFSIVVQNLSTDVVENIQFTSSKPEGWEIKFEPEKIETIDAFSKQDVDVIIKPPPKAVAGDYVISFRASGKQTSADEVNVRVTVKTPTIWGWIGVAIIVVVVIGLVFVFMRFSRR
jgi:uncharacterized membrane protein